MEKNNLWLITPKTNMHVGSENSSSYGLIDLSIQRDAVTDLPCVNSSSLKGAINEYAVRMTNLDDNSLIQIFGANKKVKKGDTQKGGYTFFDAQLLAIPRPCDNKPYELVTCREVIQMCIEKAMAMGVEITEDDLKVQDMKIVEYQEFNELCKDDNLPIIARNKIGDDGTSENLWYEQVLPAESVLFTMIDPVKGQADMLAEEINGKTIQVGANGSIGYGYCIFKHL